MITWVNIEVILLVVRLLMAYPQILKKVLYSNSKLSEMREHIKYETAKYLQDLGYVGAYGIDLLFETRMVDMNINFRDQCRRTMGHVVKLQKLLNFQNHHFSLRNKDIIDHKALKKISQ